MGDGVSSAKYHVADKIDLRLFGLYVILKPFYFWESGLPQISDYVLVVTTILYLIICRFRIMISKKAFRFFKINLLFTYYVLIINTIWSLMLAGDTSFLKNSTYYLFNLMAIFIVLALNYKYGEDFIKQLFYAVVASSLIQFFLFLLQGNTADSRFTASFNNPNQLGYFSLLSCGICLFINHHVKVNWVGVLCSIISTVILCFASLSKAAITSYLGMLLYFLLIRQKDKKQLKKTIIIVLLVIIIVFIIARYYQFDLVSIPVIQRAIHRLSSIGKEKDDNPYARGYGRLSTYPQHLLFGIGEGAYYRFGQTMEFHSLLGNVLLSYGVIGLSLFISIMIFALIKNKWIDFYIIFWLMVYGLTHNGIRNTFFWITMALLYLDTKDRTCIGSLEG